MAIITGNFILFVDQTGQVHDALITEKKDNGLLNLVYLKIADGKLLGYQQETSVSEKEPGGVNGWVELKYYGQEIK